jgi:hypothetical protein
MSPNPLPDLGSGAESRTPTKDKEREREREREREMKRIITTLALSGVLMAVAVPTAFANSEHSNDSAGAGTTECRPGAGNDLVGSWESMTMDAYIEALADRYGVTIDPEDPDYQRIVDAAQGTWDFCDKNLDGLLCVMTTDPSPYYYTLLDNRPFPG